MRLRLLGWASMLIVLGTGAVLAEAQTQDLNNFHMADWYSGVHRTRAGKDFWYSAANGGFEAFTNVPMSELGCKECHGPTNALGNPYTGTYEPGCYDCHPADENFYNLSESQCYGCHGRQAAEAGPLALPDVHRAAGMKCWDCHNSSDMHGDGNPYQSMLEPGALMADCENCHATETLPAGHSAYDPHGGKLHCSACHTQSVVSCYNCHFESQVVSHVKRAKQPLSGFVLLVNREKDGKVGTASFQSLTYQGNAFAAIAPYSGHSTVSQGRVCTDCHVNPPIGGTNAAIEQYNATGRIQFATWNSADSTLTWLRGAIPMPADYATSFKMDFITYTGNTSDPAGPSKKWVSIGKNTWDGHQMFFATPLTRTQMAKLGMGPDATFGTSLHATRAGKQYWYGAANGGFEAFTGVPISAIGCRECHGPTNADGVAYGSGYTPGCVDCHPTSNWSAVSQNQCYSCHSRQKTEAVVLGLPDVHRAAGMECRDCHGWEDMHGDGTAYANQFEPGAIKADCENCHEEGDLPPSHAAADPHDGKLHCSACHATTVISCYNCHFESQVQTQIKRAKQTISGFVMLGNRAKDGKVGTMSFQSLTNAGTAFVAFAPFAPHTITRDGRVCTDCHVNSPINGSNAAILQYNTLGQIRFATWNSADSTLAWLRGVVPIPEDYETRFKMDFITYTGNTSDPAGPSKKWVSIGKNTWDGHQMFYASPLTRDQMDAMGFATFSPSAALGTGNGTPELVLGTAWPNPFQSSTRIQYSLPAEARVRITIYDVSGRVVRTLVDEVQDPGEHGAFWDGRAGDGSPSAAGMYLVRVEAGGARRTLRVLRIN